MTFTRTTNTLKSGTGRRRLSTHVATEFVARVVLPAHIPSPLCIPCTGIRLGAFGLTLRPAIFERPGHEKGSPTDAANCITVLVLVLDFEKEISL
jgi:hypothetical protein